MSQLPLNLNLHPKQGKAFETPATEVLYGGAAGGGKSHLMRAASIIWAAMIPGLQVYLFRRIRDDLIKNHVEGPKGYRAMLAEWEAAGFVKIVEDEIRFWNGSKIYICHCKDAKDVYKYQGAEIHVLLIDELTHFTEDMYRFLRNRVRMVGMEIPTKWVGHFPRILCGSNPGNIGHLWVKATFIEFAPEYEITETPDKEGGMLRQFIPARLEDNPSMAKDDPHYETRLCGLGSEALVRAMRWGDWDIVEGAFFDCWHDWKRHGGILKPFELPDFWLRFRSFDWGSARPFSCGWWAVASDDCPRPEGIIPRGALVRYREWYGKQSPNVGLKMNAADVAKGIRERTLDDEEISYSTADPSIFAQDGGPSIAERMLNAGVLTTRADNRRVGKLGALGGWDQMRERFAGEEIGGEARPMIYCFDTCHDSIRTIPVLQHDQVRAEDLDTESEDHAADDWRYACMSRPYVRPDGQKPKPKQQPGQVVLPGPPEPSKGTRIRI